MINKIKNFFKKILLLSIWVIISGIAASLYQVIYFKYFSPALTNKMYSNKLDLLFGKEKDKKIYYEWVDLDQVSLYVPLAVIAAEDQKFPQHFGLDYDAIKKAFTYNRNSKRIRGASTISQQVAKNVFLWHDRTMIRKILELYYTFLIELVWGKKRILEMYVNIAEMGPNTYGVGAAAKKYWNKPAHKITKYEAGILAAVLPNPNLLSAQRPSGYVIRRREWILKQMGQLGDLNYLKPIMQNTNEKNG